MLASGMGDDRLEQFSLIKGADNCCDHVHELEVLPRFQDQGAADRTRWHCFSWLARRLCKAHYRRDREVGQGGPGGQHQGGVRVGLGLTFHNVSFGEWRVPRACTHKPRSARSVDPALSRDKSLPARRLSWASPGVTASRTGRPLASTAHESCWSTRLGSVPSTAFYFE